LAAFNCPPSEFQPASLRLGQCALNLDLVARLHLVAALLQHLLDVVDHASRADCAPRSLLALLLVLGRMRLGFLRHALDFFLAQTRRDVIVIF
jgi:hypothetical protein